MFGLLFGALGAWTFKAVGWASAWGFLAGEFLGNLFFGRKSGYQKPSVQDVLIQDAGYGLAIPITYGTVWTGGIVVEDGGVEAREIKARVGEQSIFFITFGGDTETIGYDYYATWATIFGEGPVDAVLAIKFDGEIWADWRESASTDMRDDSDEKLATGKVKIYLGTQDQEVDPTLAALYEDGKVPAYRGRVLLVFDDVYIGRDYAQLPNVTILVATNAAANPSLWEEMEPPAGFAERGAHATAVVDNELFVLGGINDTGTLSDFWKYHSENGWTQLTPIPVGRDSFTLTKRVLSNGKIVLYAMGGSEITETENDLVDEEEAVFRYDIETDTWSDAIELIPEVPEDGVPFPRDGHQCTWYNNAFYLSCGDDGIVNADLWSSPDGATWYKHTTNCGLGVRRDHFQIFFKNEMYAGGGWSQWGGEYLRALYKFNDSSKSYQQIPIVVTDRNGVVHEDGYFPGSDKYVVGASVWGSSLMVFMRDESATFTKIFLSEDTVNWTEITDVFGNRLENDATDMYASYDQLVNRVYVIGGGDNFLSNPTNAIWRSNPAYAAYEPVSISSIIEDLSNRVGVNLEEINTTELDDIFVEGYAIRQTAPASNAIASLMSFGMFDITQDDTLRFLKRGSDRYVPDCGITADDLGIMDRTSGGGNPPDQLDLKRTQESALPQKVNLAYLDIDRDGEAGLQPASNDTTTKTRRIEQIDLPIMMSASTAKTLAEIILKNRWNERHPCRFTLFPKYAWLLPTDVVSFAYKSGTYTFRITEILIGANRIMEIDGIVEDLALYDNYYSLAYGQMYERQDVSTGGSGYTAPERVYPLSTFFLLNIPALRKSDDDYGFYFGAAPIVADDSKWNGAKLQRYDSLETEYVTVCETNRATAYGKVTGNPLPFRSEFLPDRASRLEVMLTYGEIPKVSLTSPLLAKVGDEIIYAAAKSYDSETGVYTLSNLLRGQLGTGWAVGSHIANEEFIVLNALTRISLDRHMIGDQHYFRVQTIGSYTASVPEAFTSASIAKKPWPPYFHSAKRNKTTLHWEIHFLPRARLYRGIWDRSDRDRPYIFEMEILAGGESIAILQKEFPSTTESFSFDYYKNQQINDFGIEQSLLEVNLREIDANLRQFVGYSNQQYLSPKGVFNVPVKTTMEIAALSNPRAGTLAWNETDSTFRIFDGDEWAIISLAYTTESLRTPSGSRESGTVFWSSHHQQLLVNDGSEWRIAIAGPADGSAELASIRYPWEGQIVWIHEVKRLYVRAARAWHQVVTGYSL